MTTDTEYRVVSLAVTNVRSITAADITPPDVGGVIVSGKNGAGKSSLIESLIMGLGGSKAEYRRAIQEGKKKAQILIDLGPFKVKCTIHPDRQTLELVGPDGEKMPQPQKTLDSLIGDLSFDPLAVANMRPADRIGVCMDMAGLRKKLDQIAAAREDAYNERTIVNRQIRDSEGVLQSITKPDADVPDEPIALGPLVAEKNRRQGIINANADKRRAFEDNKGAIQQHIESREIILQQIARLHEQIAELDEVIEHRTAKAKVLSGEIDALVDPSTEEIDAQILDAEEKNHAINAAANYRKAKAAHEDLFAESESYTKKIEGLDNFRDTELAGAELPVPGLSFDGEDLTLRGIHFSQLSTGELLRVSMAMAMAMNPTLRIILIKHGSELDDDNLAVICEEAEKHRYQVFIERVPIDDKTMIVVENGVVTQKE